MLTIKCLSRSRITATAPPPTFLKIKRQASTHPLQITRQITPELLPILLLKRKARTYQFRRYAIFELLHDVEQWDGDRQF